jgi:malate synthase
VPIDNARYALNAANARWGSLLDALYGSNVIDEDGGATRAGAYNPVRGAKVFAYCHSFLDEVLPLAQGCYDDVVGYSAVDGGLACALKGGSTTGLRDPKAFAGFNRGVDGELSSVLLMKNGLHAELCIDRKHPVGAAHAAGLKDIVLESAISAICDCEDSVAAVDANDKAKVYRNWTGLMKGTLTDTFNKGGKPQTRSLNPDKVFTTPSGEPLTISGRSMLLVPPNAALPPQPFTFPLRARCAMWASTCTPPL